MWPPCVPPTVSPPSVQRDGAWVRSSETHAVRTNLCGCNVAAVCPSHCVAPLCVSLIVPRVAQRRDDLKHASASWARTLRRIRCPRRCRPPAQMECRLAVTVALRTHHECHRIPRRHGVVSRRRRGLLSPAPVCDFVSDAVVPVLLSLGVFSWVYASQMKLLRPL